MTEEQTQQTQQIEVQQQQQPTDSLAKLGAALKKGLGAAVDDNFLLLLKDNNYDPEAVGKELSERLERTMTPPLKGRFLDEFQRKTLNRFSEAGYLKTEDKKSLEKLPLEDMLGAILVEVNKKREAGLTEEQRNVTEQVEKAVKTAKAEAQSQIEELQKKINEFESEKKRQERTILVKQNLPKDTNLTDVALEAVLSILDKRVDLKIENGKINPYYPNTDTPFGLKDTNPKLYELKDILAQIISELGISTGKKQEQQRVPIVEIPNIDVVTNTQVGGADKLAALRKQLGIK